MESRGVAAVAYIGETAATAWFDACQSIIGGADVFDTLH
jgi:hypothetical protein